MRILNSITHYDFDIMCAMLFGGVSLAPYLQAFNVSLFLHEDDVQAAVNVGSVAALLYQKPYNVRSELDQICIAFDSGAVIFSDESERIYFNEGIEGFEKKRARDRHTAVTARSFRASADCAVVYPEQFEESRRPCRTVLVTTRSSPAPERVIRILRAWNVAIDETFFMGGGVKSDVLAELSIRTCFSTISVVIATVPPAACKPIGYRLSISMSWINRHNARCL